MVAVRNTATMSPKRNICPKVNIYHGPIFKQSGLQCIWGQKSSGAVPFTTLFAILVLRFAVSVPLVFSGAYTGLRKDRVELPVRTDQIHRAIPDQPVNMQPITTSLVGGILPFGAVFTELFFIMSSTWNHEFYYLFGFLSLVLLIVLITCAEISIALTYFQLTSEDYRWWWTSFSASGSSGLYVFLYSIMYFNSRFQIRHWVSVLMYFGYMFIMSCIFPLISGAVGFLQHLRLMGPSRLRAPKRQAAWHGWDVASPSRMPRCLWLRQSCKGKAWRHR